MGDRANVVLYNETKEGIEYSPIIYTHWGGGNVEKCIEDIANLYENFTGDTNWEADMRIEIERVFPKFLLSYAKYELEPNVYNFDNAHKYKQKLPTANDTPIIADDRGLYRVNINGFRYTVSHYDWDKALA